MQDTTRQKWQYGYKEPDPIKPDEMADAVTQFIIDKYKMRTNVHLKPIHFKFMDGKQQYEMWITFDVRDWKPECENGHPDFWSISHHYLIDQIDRIVFQWNDPKKMFVP